MLSLSQFVTKVISEGDSRFLNMTSTRLKNNVKSVFGDLPPFEVR